MKYIKIKIGDYDIKKLNEIFENEKDFKPAAHEDQIIIDIMRQCINEENIIEEIEEKEE
jgi:hypothetical protein